MPVCTDYSSVWMHAQILPLQVDDVIRKEDKNKKVSAKSEPQEYENTNSEIYEKELHDLGKLSLDDSHKK